MNWLKFFEAIFGTAEQIVPIFIHNPKSQQIEGLIVTTTTGLLAAAAGVQSAPAIPSKIP